ncbi:MAG TPA: sialidase family protein [Candidatus Dormibacteraeota bacterium]|jgi:photosystem II stability/assembly factor-like uncharacterized protein|nr:sialidase family protein [Candidatus Dormibacteraeota bacterium]
MPSDELRVARLLQLPKRLARYSAAALGAAAALAGIIPVSAVAASQPLDRLIHGLRGSSWQVVAGQPNFGKRLTDIEVDPSDPAFLLATIDGGDVTLSKDGGRTWRELQTPAGGLSSGAIWHSGTHRDVFVAGERGLYRTGDQGAHWEQLASQPGRVSVYSSVILFSLAGQLWRSDLPNVSWTRFTFADQPGIGLAYEWTNDGHETILRAAISSRTGQVVVSRKNGGAPFQSASLPAAAHQPWRFLALPGSATVFAAAVGIWRSDDAGRTWQRASAAPASGLSGDDPTRTCCSLLTSLQLIRIDGQQILLTGGVAGVAASADGGHSWTPVDNAIGPPTLPSFGLVTAAPAADGLGMVAAIPSAIAYNRISGLKADLVTPGAGALSDPGGYWTLSTILLVGAGVGALMLVIAAGSRLPWWGRIRRRSGIES